ncbi:MAG: matrixin family metalloprotease [Gemmatimonadota bacterium]
MEIRLGKPGPLGLVAAALIMGGGGKAWLDGRPADPHPDRCDPVREECPELPGAPRPPAPPPGIAAGDFCVNVGYLCADLDSRSEVQLRRWKDHEGTIVVHIPLPEGEEPTVARGLQRAAAQGIQVWDNQPFPILADLRGDRNPHFAVEWKRGMGGNRIGVARTRWTAAFGIEVDVIELSTRYPGQEWTAAESHQVRLTAAHEMGHALGLGHSDQPRDVMYPTNTATSMSSRDYRSIEVLYDTPDGTVIRR